MGIRAAPGLPYDGHTLKDQIAQVERLTGVKVTRASVDKGYRGHGLVVPEVRIRAGHEDEPDLYRQTLNFAAAPAPSSRSSLMRQQTACLNAIASPGARGDAINAILVGAGHNIRLLLAWLRAILSFLHTLFISNRSWKPIALENRRALISALGRKTPFRRRLATCRRSKTHGQRASGHALRIWRATRPSQGVRKQKRFGAICPAGPRRSSFGWDATCSILGAKPSSIAAASTTLARIKTEAGNESAAATLLALDRRTECDLARELQKPRSAARGPTPRTFCDYPGRGRSHRTIRRSANCKIQGPCVIQALSKVTNGYRGAMWAPSMLKRERPLTTGSTPQGSSGRQSVSRLTSSALA